MFLKISFDKQIHLLSSQPTMQELRDFIDNHFKNLPESYEISYIDEDGDKIMVTNDHDIKAMYDITRSKFVRLEVKPANSTSLEGQKENEPQKNKTTESDNISTQLLQSAIPKQSQLLDNKNQKEMDHQRQDTDIQKSQMSQMATIMETREPSSPSVEIEPKQPQPQTDANIRQAKEEKQTKEQPAIKQVVSEESSDVSEHEVPYEKSKQYIKDKAKMQAEKEAQEFSTYVTKNSLSKSMYPSSFGVRSRVKSMGGYNPPVRAFRSTGEIVDRGNPIDQILADPSDKLRSYIQKTVTDMIPYIIKQVKKALQDPEFNPEAGEEVEHRYVQCDNCGVIPIMGVRYKCTTCANFDLCEKCEQLTGHPHDLLKMRQAQPRCAHRHTMANIFTAPSAVWKDEKRGGSSEEKRVNSVQKRASKLAETFGGRPQEYIRFAQETRGLRPCEAKRAFKQRYNAIPVENTQKNEKRAWKLSYIVQRPYQQMLKLVKQNPGKNIYQLKNLLIKGTSSSDLSQVEVMRGVGNRIPEYRAEPKIQLKIQVKNTNKPQIKEDTKLQGASPKSDSSRSLTQKSKKEAKSAIDNSSSEQKETHKNYFPPDEPDLTEKTQLLQALQPMVRKNTDLIDFVRRNYKQTIQKAVDLYFEEH